eukprot:15329063-Alexandrium_andersonii.AAC.1
MQPVRDHRSAPSHSSWFPRPRSAWPFEQATQSPPGAQGDQRRVSVVVLACVSRVDGQGAWCFRPGRASSGQ